jgi:hypothetical protein
MVDGIFYFAIIMLNQKLANTWDWLKNVEYYIIMSIVQFILANLLAYCVCSVFFILFAGIIYLLCTILQPSQHIRCLETCLALLALIAASGFIILDIYIILYTDTGYF